MLFNLNNFILDSSYGKFRLSKLHYPCHLIIIITLWTAFIVVTPTRNGCQTFCTEFCPHEMINILCYYFDNSNNVDLYDTSNKSIYTLRQLGRSFPCTTQYHLLIHRYPDTTRAITQTPGDNRSYSQLREL